ncbi:MAG: DUF4339 domain-containing protein [Calothrix sp. SM1_5_4]|nr:DUF4339 domain-containing protein [Calothrix sp. SM1_5_4]
MVSHLDEQIGPFDEAELKAKWTKGEILPIDYVYDETKQDWILIAEKFSWATNKREESLMPPPLRSDTVVTRRVPPALSRVTETPAVAPPVTPAKPVAGTKVKLVEGVGEIELSPLNPGKVELLVDPSATMLKLTEPLRIDVKPAEPVEIVWTVANQLAVGQDLEVSLRALDENGNVCLHYTDEFTLQVRGNTPRDMKLITNDGAASVRLNHTKAESWTVSLVYSGKKSLKLPETKTVEWQPGPAVRLILDGPQEYTAGIPLKVQVKAVDSFGNLARTFQGTVVLEVKAS